MKGTITPISVDNPTAYTFDSVALDDAYRLLDASPLQSIGPV